MNNAKNRPPQCVHGVNILLDAAHSCFECEKQALAQGLPIEMRIMDGANVMLFHAHMQATEMAKVNGVDTLPSVPPQAPTHALSGLDAAFGQGFAEHYRKATRAPAIDFAKPTAPVMRIDGTPWTGDAVNRLINDLRAPRDINGDAWPTDPRLGETAAPVDGEVKALQRALIEMRRELVEVSADRNAFARENMELIRTVDDLRAKLRSINVIVNDDTKATR